MVFLFLSFLKIYDFLENLTTVLHGGRIFFSYVVIELITTSLKLLILHLSSMLDVQHGAHIMSRREPEITLISKHDVRLGGNSNQLDTQLDSSNVFSHRISRVR